MPPRKGKISKDTLSILEKGQSLSELVKSNGWKEAKRILFQKLIEFDSISSIVKEGRSNIEIADEVIKREAIIQMIKQWINEVEGEAMQADSVNREFMESMKKERIAEESNLGYTETFLNGD